MSKIREEFAAFGNFPRECRAEIGEITWPSRQELIGSTWVVGGLLLLVAFFVYFCDSILAAVITWLTGLMA